MLRDKGVASRGGDSVTLRSKPIESLDNSLS
jgi:hypothetical protein